MGAVWCITPETIKTHKKGWYTTMTTRKQKIEARRTQERKETERLIIAVATISLVVGIAVANLFSYVSTNGLPKPSRPCTWGECHCYEGYDSFGRWYNDNPYNYHCIEHGDGHDCY